MECVLDENSEISVDLKKVPDKLFSFQVLKMLFSCKIYQMFSLKSTTVMVTGYSDCCFLMDSNSENRDNNKRFLVLSIEDIFFFTSEKQFNKLAVIVFF